MSVNAVFNIVCAPCARSFFQCSDRMLCLGVQTHLFYAVSNLMINVCKPLFSMQCSYAGSGCSISIVDAVFNLMCSMCARAFVQCVDRTGHNPVEW